MAYRTPTSRKKKVVRQGLNLIPILDSVFILIFFLLMSTQFIKINEISSDVPIVSNTPPPKTNKKPLALTVRINSTGFSVLTGVPGKVRQKISKTADGTYNLTALHEILVKIKRNNVNEETIILEPLVDIEYKEIVEIMDAVRSLNKTDGTFTKKDKDGIDVVIKTLFSKIMFGNIMS